MAQKDAQQHGLKEGRENVTIVVWSFGEQRTHMGQTSYYNSCWKIQWLV